MRTVDFNIEQYLILSRWKDNINEWLIKPRKITFSVDVGVVDKFLYSVEHPRARHAQYYPNYSITAPPAMYLTLALTILSTTSNSISSLGAYNMVYPSVSPTPLALCR